MKITGIVKSASEITKCAGIKEFSGDGFRYSEEMNKLAGLIIKLTPRWEYYSDHRSVSSVSSQEEQYDFFSKVFSWKREWLKDIKEETEELETTEILWPFFKVDTKLRVWNKDGVKWHRHFAFQLKGKIYCWKDGRTSWTTIKTDYDDTSAWDNADTWDDGKQDIKKEVTITNTNKRRYYD